jgi:hypothetical protein
VNTNLVVPGELKKIQDIPRNQNYPLDKQQKREKLLGFYFLFLTKLGNYHTRKLQGCGSLFFFSLSFLLLLYYCAIVRAFYFHAL